MLKRSKKKPSTVSRAILEAVLTTCRMTQSQLAERLGVHRSLLTRINSGQLDFTDDQRDSIERMLGRPLPLVLLGPEPAPDAPGHANQYYREALELLTMPVSFRTTP